MTFFENIFSKYSLYIKDSLLRGVQWSILEVLNKNSSSVYFNSANSWMIENHDFFKEDASPIRMKDPKYVVDEDDSSVDSDSSEESNLEESPESTIYHYLEDKEDGEWLFYYRDGAINQEKSGNYVEGNKSAPS